MTKGAIALALLALAAVTASGDQAPIPYPEGYRGWMHVSSALVGPGSPAYPRYGGLHNIYANAKAVEGYRTGRFDDGAVIVFDLFEVEEAHGSTSMRSRKFIDVMVKDAKRFATTGGWGFEEFAGDSRTEGRLTAQQQAQCFACHRKLAADDLVIGTLR